MANSGAHAQRLQVQMMIQNGVPCENVAVV